MTDTIALGALETMRPPVNLRGKHASWVLAVAMHVGLAAVLIYGLQWQTKPPQTVSVDLVRALPPINAVPSAPTESIKPEPLPEPPTKAAPEAPKFQARPVPVKPPPVPVSPDIAIKEKVKPKPPVDKPVPVIAPPPNPFAEEMKKEEQRIRAQKTASQAEDELKKMREVQAIGAKKKLTDAWISQIQAKVRGNIILPSQARGNPEAVFEVTQLPSGEILSVRLKQSCGIPMLDTAIERAILKSSPLPKPERPDLFERALELRVRPMDKESI